MVEFPPSRHMDWGSVVFSHLGRGLPGRGLGSEMNMSHPRRMLAVAFAVSACPFSSWVLLWPQVRRLRCLYSRRRLLRCKPPSGWRHS